MEHLVPTDWSDKSQPWRLYVPERDLSEIMHALEDTQEIHTPDGARKHGFDRALLPGVFLAAGAKRVADAVTSSPTRALEKLEIKISDVAMTDRDLMLETVSDNGAVTVWGTDEGRPVFTAAVSYRNPREPTVVDVRDSIGTSRGMPLNSDEWRQEADAFYHALGLEHDWFDEGAPSLILARSVPPMLGFVDQLANDGRNYLIGKIGIRGLVTHSEIGPIDIPINTTEVRAVNVPLERLGRGRGKIDMQGLYRNGDLEIPTYATSFTLLRAEAHK